MNRLTLITLVGAVLVVTAFLAIMAPVAIGSICGPGT